MHYDFSESQVNDAEKVAVSYSRRIQEQLALASVYIRNAGQLSVEMEREISALRARSFLRSIPGGSNGGAELQSGEPDRVVVSL